MENRTKEADIDALLMGMAELQTEVEANTRAMDAATTEIARLRARVAELESAAQEVVKFHDTMDQTLDARMRLMAVLRRQIDCHLSANGQHSGEPVDSKGPK